MNSNGKEQSKGKNALNVSGDNALEQGSHYHSLKRKRVPFSSITLIASIIFTFQVYLLLNWKGKGSFFNHVPEFFTWVWVAGFGVLAPGIPILCIIMFIGLLMKRYYGWMWLLSVLAIYSIALYYLLQWIVS